MMSSNGTSSFSNKPLYIQVRNALAERIARGAWKPGAAVPSEGDLAREMGVSAGTMRKALDLLERDRLISRRQGRGTFVNDPSCDELATRFINIRGPDGKRIVGDVKSVEITAGVATDKEVRRLDLKSGEKVYRLRRTRFIGERPFMLEEASVPTSLFPGLEQMGKLARRIVTLAQHYGILLGKAEEHISIGIATAKVAEALHLAEGAPMVVLDRVVHTTDGRPVEWRMACCDLSENHYFSLMD
jgi:GntR family transcriptional regulator